MLRTMLTATNTMNQLQQHMDTIGHNLANSSTAGYKARDAKFHELLYQQFDNDKADQAVRQSPDGIRYGSGAMLGQSVMNWQAGSLQETGRPLDFAFTAPKQYFKVRMETETGMREVYTRQGAFQAVPAAGGGLALVTNEGHPVLDVAGNPVTFREGATGYEAVDNGILRVRYADGTEQAIPLGVVEVQRPQLMEQLSGTYIGLPDTDALGVAADDVLTDLQGAGRQDIGLANNKLESSNVDYQKELTDLMNVQRSYQFNSRALTIADQMLGLINGIR
ncbi:flagellar hook-basal body protein [Indiicoccus explosivorum]|uniref:flagellar hook-basal body protein n=1 Tax=Indiicoccus explosivorum TaxID=1917864 RepID=UPI000B4540E5|nr:flagellar hook-basal body protein [Indiicoccus explosivorum]